MQYRTLADLSATIRRNIHRIPRSFAVVAGIPRSGMIAASMIATMLDKPLANVNELIKDSWRNPIHGGRWGYSASDSVLLVDDTISGGQTFMRVVNDLQDASDPDIEIHNFAVYGKPGSPNIHTVLEVVPGPRIFEWNWTKHPSHLKTAVLDIDGVLCTENEKITDRNDQEHVRGVRERAQPLFLPSRSVLAIATGRRENERAQTEAWLAKHGVQYGQLFMAGPVCGAKRTKLRAIKETGAKWMVESNLEQAEWLAAEAKVPVLCTDANRMISPQ